MSKRNVTFLIGANYDNFKNNLSGAEKRFRQFSRTAKKIGSNLQRYVTLPLIGIGAAATKAFATQEKAEKKLRAALQSNGREVESLFNRYSSFAKQMQKLTVVGDETTLAMLQQAETMGLTGDAAERAVKNAIAMQSAFDVSADRAIRYTAALEKGNSTMLNRYIPTLQSINDESRRAAKAQEILAGAFETAKAEAQSKEGQLQQFKNTIGDFGEKVGEVILRAISPYTEKIQKATHALGEMNLEQIESKVKIMAVAAAIGPAILLTNKLAVATVSLTKASKTLIATLAKHPYIALLGVMVALGVEASITAKRVRSLNDAIDEALNSDASLTQHTLEEINDLIVAIEKRKEAITKDFNPTTPQAVKAYRGTMEELNDQLERMIELRDKIAMKQLDEVIASKQADETADALVRINTEISKLKPVVEQSRPISEIIDPEQIWEAARIMRIMSQDINDIVAGWEAADDLGGPIPTPEEKKRFEEFAYTGAELFERMAFSGERLDRALGSILARIASQGVLNLLIGLLSGGTSGIASKGFFKTFFGGFFATGGNLPMGQWGITGERGPEVIMPTPSGAVITPLTGSRAPAPAARGGGGSGQMAVVNVYMDSFLVDRQLTRFREGRP